MMHHQAKENLCAAETARGLVITQRKGNKAMTSKSVAQNRYFTKKQKRSMYIAAGGLCEMCGEILGEEWDAHHALEHSKNGKTQNNNAVALCKDCHKQIHKGGN